jgi:hypothetical protein
MSQLDKGKPVARRGRKATGLRRGGSRATERRSASYYQAGTAREGVCSRLRPQGHTHHHRAYQRRWGQGQVLEMWSVRTGVGQRRGGAGGAVGGERGPLAPLVRLVPSPLPRGKRACDLTPLAYRFQRPANQALRLETAREGARHDRCVLMVAQRPVHPTCDGVTSDGSEGSPEKL